MKCLLVILIGFMILSSERGLAVAEDGGRPPIEIVVGGKSYPSLEVYQKERLKALDDKPALEKEIRTEDELTEIQAMFDEAVKNARSPLELSLDPQKMKTIYLTKTEEHFMERFKADYEQALRNNDSWSQAYKLINEMGFNNGIHRVIDDFKLNGKQSAEVIKTNDLEQVLKDSLNNVNQPILLLSDEDSVRVMALEAGDYAEGTEAEAIKTLQDSVVNP